MAPPVGTNAQHWPHKTRLLSHSGSCNRRKLVYGLVYDQNPGHVPPNPLGDTVYSSDLRSGPGYRQPAASACFSDTWRLHLCGRVQGVCMPLLLRRMVMLNACCCSPIIPGNRYCSTRGPMHGPQGVYVVSIHGLCQWSALWVCKPLLVQFRVSLP